MSENTALWDKLGKTDPSHTKAFNRAGGFKGTAIKPMWSYRRMTEEFGPCGTGWGVNQPSFQVVPAGEEILVYCTVSIWYSVEAVGDGDKIYRSPRDSVFGVGGDKVLVKQQSGLRSDDEAFKKAYTDAVTNALKMIGVGADVHMGLFDDNKYVNTMVKEFAEHSEPQTQPKSSAALKRAKSWEELSNELEQDMVDVRSLVNLEQVKAHYRQRAKSEGWTAAWLSALKNEFDTYEERLMERIALEQVEDDIADAFPGARVVNEVLKNPMAVG